jgi:hypothetical protein
MPGLPGPADPRSAEVALIRRVANDLARRVALVPFQVGDGWSLSAALCACLAERIGSYYRERVAPGVPA